MMTASQLIFDSARMEIKAEHILASSGYPIYGSPWIEVDNKNKENNGIGDYAASNSNATYAWDGGLLSNTLVREVLSVSPRNDKNIFRELSKKSSQTSSNIPEVESRARDILFSDENLDTIKMSRLVTRKIRLIERLYSIFENNNIVDQSKVDPKEIKEIKS